MIFNDSEVLASKIVGRLRYYGWLHAMANESSVIQEIGRILSNHDAEVRKSLAEALREGLIANSRMEAQRLNRAIQVNRARHAKGIH